MSKSIKLIAALSAVVFVAACDNDVERALGGAAAGAVIGEATGNDVGTSAAAGALAGVFCDDAGVCN
ncbi:hypothetical protein [Pseudooctadecabacter jejudonensis]|uniref:YMGG-like Gly-zipper domain-containing protein n=1 Tax=Pseudooctadecabacter jejudonensis TaxID=1391910 RepID=A0A1Y5SHE7_9RHOB|nr:hypothetical protein [Pseudooctadecabacter jejudonensis]SLN39724.1 hypothetical protein PSJ8397_01967 [Pseudooctadecabacter jejudonensis]